MSIVDNGTGSPASLVERVKAILLNPKETWRRIDGEPATIQGLYTGYVCILAAIPAICGFIGSQLALGGLGFLVGGAISAVLNYALSLAMVYVMALIIEALAPSFDGVKDRLQAFKVAAYGLTAVWVSGVLALLLVFAAIPFIGWLPSLIAVLGMIAGGVYSLYLVYLGLPLLMKSPQDKAVVYTIVVCIIGLVLNLLAAGLVSSVSAAAGVGSRIGGFTGASVDRTIKFGGAEINVGKLEEASKQMEATARQMEAGVSGVPGAAGGAVKAIPGETLKALLPAVAGYDRSEITSETNSVGGFSGSKAEARYEKGDSRMTVEIIDMGAAGALAGLAGAVKVDHTKETATGYEKVSTTGGRIITEEYDRSAKSGKYGAMVGSRFAVEARGEQVAMNDLKGAVDAVNLAQLEALAR